MKKIWVLVLLISLGLNLGFGLRMLNDRSGSGEGRHSQRSGESHRFHGRWADRDSVARGKMFARRLEHIADTLDLSPEQRDEFAEVHAQTGRKLMRRRGLISEKRDLLHTLMTSDEIDQDGIRLAISELGQEQAVLDSLVAETMLQEMAVLAPDQRVRYLELLSFEKKGARPDAGSGRPRVGPSIILVDSKGPDFLLITGDEGVRPFRAPTVPHPSQGFSPGFPHSPEMSRGGTQS